jgi:hypothetical protein
MFTPRNSVRLLVALIVSVTAPVLFAAQPHYKNGGTPSCSPATSSVTGTTYTGSCTAGSAAGLGNGDIAIVITVTGSAGTFCHNKGNPDNIVRGQNPAIGTSVTPINIPSPNDKNGTVAIPPIGPFTLALNAPSPEAAGCPGSNWTVTLGTASFSGLYSFQQPLGTQIDSLSFTF